MTKKTRPPKVPKMPKAPKAKDILRERERYELTQADAAALIYYTLNGWQRLEYGQRAMQPALWELWQTKAKAEADRRAADRGAEVAG